MADSGDVLLVGLTVEQCIALVNLDESEHGTEEMIVLEDIVKRAGRFAAAHTGVMAYLPIEDRRLDVDLDQDPA
jgi:hypothetical protein